MNKNIKRIIACTLTISAFSIVSAITPGTSLDIGTKLVYASSYSPSLGELKKLTVKSTNGDTLDLRDDYNGSDVELNDDKEYYVKLTDDSDGVKINTTVKGDDYIVKIFTSDDSDATSYSPDDEIQLAKGNTTLYVRTYESLSAFRKAKDVKKDVTECEEEYKINIKKTTENSYEDDNQDDIYLKNIKLSKSDITFFKQRTSYDVKVDSSVSEIKVTAEPDSDNDRVRINGSLVDDGDNYKKNVSLSKGKNEIKIKVTDSKDNQRTYTLNVTRGSSSSSDDKDELDLSDLTVSEGDIDFSADTRSYNIDLDESVSKITIGAEPEDTEYLVTINGDEVNGDDDYKKKVSLSKGENTIKIVVKDELNDEKGTYTLTVNRGKEEETEKNQSASTEQKTEETKNTEQTQSQTTTNKSGWTQTTDGWKYSDENGNFLKSKWLFDKQEGVYCYLGDDGLRKTGWLKDKDKWYLLDQKGAMLTGWQEVDGKKYFMDESGAMKTGWLLQEVKVESNGTNSTDNTKNADNSNNVIDNWYYLNSDGSMRTGWLLDQEKWYYLNANGIMQKGWIIDSNSKYYLKQDGSMVIGTNTIDGKKYKFANSGALII